MLGRRVLGDSSYTDLFPGSHPYSNFACGEFGTEYYEEVSEEKASGLGGGGRENSEQILERDTLCRVRQEGRKVMERVQGSPYDSSTPGVAHLS